MQFHSAANDSIVALKDGLIYAIGRAISTKNGKVLLYTPRKDSLDYGNSIRTVVTDILGVNFLDTIKKDRLASPCSDLTMYWETPATARKHTIGRDFVAFGAIVSPNDMRTIIDDNRTVDSVFAPFTASELSTYLTYYPASQKI